MNRLKDFLRLTALRNLSVIFLLCLLFFLALLRLTDSAINPKKSGQEITHVKNPIELNPSVYVQTIFEIPGDHFFPDDLGTLKFNQYNHCYDVYSSSITHITRSNGGVFIYGENNPSNRERRFPKFAGQYGCREKDSIFTSLTLIKVMDRFIEHGPFFRISRNSIININYVKGFNENSIEMKDGRILKFSGDRRCKFLSFYSLCIIQIIQKTEIDYKANRDIVDPPNNNK